MIPGSQVGSDDGNCFLAFFKQGIQFKFTWYLGMPFYRGNYVIFDMTPYDRNEGFNQMVWAKQNQTDDERILPANTTDDSSIIIPLDPTNDDDDDDHSRFNPTEEDKIRFGIIAGAIFSACVVVTIVACICKKRRDKKNSRAFSDFFADEGTLKHRIQ